MKMNAIIDDVDALRWLHSLSVILVLYRYMYFNVDMTMHNIV